MVEWILRTNYAVSDLKHYLDGISDITSTEEDPGLRIESFAIIKLRGVSTKI